MLSSVFRKLGNYFSRKLNDDSMKFIVRDWQPLFELKASNQILETKRFTQNLKPIVVDELSVNKVLVISPHPDDDAFGCAGTLLKFSNLEIITIYVTDAGDTKEDINKLQSEANKVCKVLKSRPKFLHHEPGRIPESDERLDVILDEFNPEIIMTTFMLDDHDDHRRVNQLVSNSIKNVGYLGEIWSYQIYSTVIPNLVVNITDQMNEKYEVMNLYKTIYGNRDWPHYIKGMNAANCRFLSGKENKYAECFFALPVNEYLELTQIYFSNPPEKIYYKSYK